MDTENPIEYEDGNLSEKKEWRCNLVDKKTRELILQGFTFDGEEFSLSEVAQTNWIAMKTLEDLLTWPVNISTKNNGEYNLSQANLNAFLGAGAATKQAHLDSGRAIHIQLMAAANETELDAVTDER